MVEEMVFNILPCNPDKVISKDCLLIDELSRKILRTPLIYSSWCASGYDVNSLWLDTAQKISAILMGGSGRRRDQDDNDL